MGLKGLGGRQTHTHTQKKKREPVLNGSASLFTNSVEQKGLLVPGENFWYTNHDDSVLMKRSSFLLGIA